MKKLCGEVYKFEMFCGNILAHIRPPNKAAVLPLSRLVRLAIYSVKRELISEIRAKYRSGRYHKEMAQVGICEVNREAKYCYKIAHKTLKKNVWVG